MRIDLDPPTDRARPGTDRRSRPERIVRTGVILAFSSVGTIAILSYLLPGWPSALLVLVLLFASYLVARAWDLTRDRLFLVPWVGVSAGVAVVSILSGWHNGLTDEPFVTPAFAHLWPNLYAAPVSITYDQYGTWYTLSNLYDVYLPGLAFAEIPGLDYEWTTFVAWLGTVYLLRRRSEAVVLWGGLWVGLMAANGFNDFVPILALTLTFVTWVGARSRVAEVASLGLKQFANLVVVGVHLYHRRWKEALLAVAITAAILAPFAYLSPGGVVCHVLLIQPGDCSRGVGSALGLGFVHHVNYLLWPLFVVAVFAPGYVRALRGARPGGFRGWAGSVVRRFSRAPAERTAG